MLEPTVEQRMVKPSNLAHAADISRDTVYREIRSGRLPAVRIGGVWRISIELAEAFLRGEL